MILCLVFLFGFTPIYASSSREENLNRLPYGKNYIDFRNFTWNAYTDYGMIDLITIKPNTNYTLVIGKSFVGDFIYYQNEQPDFTLETETSSEVVPFSIDSENERWFKTFSLNVDKMKINHLMVESLGQYEIILYEGTYEAFEGFELYQSNEPSVYEGYYLVDYDHPVSTETILTTLSASDNHTRDIDLKKTVIKDEYTNREKATGEFLIAYEVKDKMSNLSVYNMHVRVIDHQKPVISGSLNYEIKTDEDHLTVEQMIDRLTLTDNADPLASLDVSIIKDDYTPNKGNVGTFEVVISVSDQSNNQQEATISVSISDTKSPRITGPDTLYKYVSDDPLTDEALRSLFQSIDNVDGNISESMIINVDGFNPNVVGLHRVYVISKDASGNQSYKTVLYHVLDDVSPNIIAASPVMTLATYEAMTETELVEWFKKDLMKQNIYPDNVKILLDEVDLDQRSKNRYVYFEYDVNGMVKQSRLTVVDQTSSNKGIIVLSALGGLLVFSAIIVYKKKH